MLAPNILWIAANRAGPWSELKYGAKMQSDAHFRRRNLHAPQGEPAPEAMSRDYGIEPLKITGKKKKMGLGLRGERRGDSGSRRYGRSRG